MADDILFCKMDKSDFINILQNALRFDQTSAAMGLVPRGVLQWTRRAADGASQAGRRLAERLRR